MLARSLARGLAALALVLWAGLVAAQANAPDYSQWQQVAERAERAVESARASDEVLAQLRADIAGWRQDFQSQLNLNDTRIQTLRDQVTALGPVPENGTEEAPEIAARRAELNAQLERLTTPRRTAEEALSRANGVIAEIDRILRDRQAEQLLNRGPSPINPANWPTALRTLSESMTETLSGTRAAFADPVRLKAAQDNLPLAVLLLIIAVVLLSRSRSWTEAMALRVQRSARYSTGTIASFLVSLGQILLPMLGLWALVRAIGATQLFGSRGQLVLDALEPMGLALFFTLWLASRFFPGDAAVHAPLPLSQERRIEGRVYTWVLGLVWAVALLLGRFSDFERYNAETDAVLHFLLTALAGLLLIRLGWVVRRAVPDPLDEEAGERAFARRFVSVVGQLTIIVGVLAPLLAAMGYGAAARALIYPTMATLALFATVSLLQNFMRDIYAALRPYEGSRDSLVPTLLSFAIALASLPFLALVWGARVTDLTEVWAMARAGLTIGGTTISPGSFLTLIVVFAIGYLLTRSVQNALKVSVLPKTRIEPGGQVAIVSGLGYVGIFLAAVVAITSAGIDLSNLAIVAGALSVGIGFGLQTIVSNFVSGIILLIERPIAEGDWIEVGGQMGFVRSISVRSTRIETFDRTDVIVPNSDLIAGTVTNYTRGNTVGRVIVPVGVAYGTDTRRVEAILRELAEAHPMALLNPPPLVLFMGFGADSLDFEIRIILRDVLSMLSVKSELNHQIAARFAQEGIEIPFAQRDVWLRNPEVLQPRPPTDRRASAPAAPGAGARDAPDSAGDADGDGDGR